MSDAPGPPRVKICGVRSPEQARQAFDAGADLIGVVFAESRRRVSLEAARAIRAALGPRVLIAEATAAALDAARREAGRPLLVGVLARRSVEEINRIAAAVDLDLVQLSGGEDAAFAARIDRPVIRAIHVEAGASDAAVAARHILEDAARSPAAITMLDTGSPQGGGSGAVFDWAVAEAVARARPIMLAGGLTPENVAEAVRRVAPWGVDVSSGVETDGLKDAAKVRAFVAAATGAAPAGGGSVP